MVIFAPRLIHPALAQSDGTGGVVGCACVILAVLLVVGLVAAINSKCDICETPIKKKSYSWKIDGKRHTLCPNCNRRMESRQSAKAFKRKFH